MRLTIVRDDNTVVVDGVRYTVDCSALPADFHALQWDGVGGEIEYSVTRCDHCGARTKKGNALITDVSPYMSLVAAWNVAKAADDSAKARAAAEARAKEEAAAAQVAKDQGALDAARPAG